MAKPKKKTGMGLSIALMIVSFLLALGMGIIILGNGYDQVYAVLAALITFTHFEMMRKTNEIKKMIYDAVEEDE